MIDQYLDFAIEEIVNLINIPSPTGFTIQATNYIFAELKKMGYNPEKTRKGSVLCHLGGDGEGVILAAHVDTLGAMVRALKSNGRLRFTKLGGYPESYIETENCLIHTRDGKKFSGTIQMINPAVHVNGELPNTKRDDKNMEVVIDAKVFSQDDLIKLGISTGDFISLDPRLVVTEEGFIKSRHLDDKASAGLLLTLAKIIKDGLIKLKQSTYLLFTTYEEVGHGASTGIPQDVVDFISVDMGAVGDDLTTDEYKVSICAKDSAGPYDYALTTELINIAKVNNLNYAVDIYPHYGSDADVALKAGYDLRHALIGPGVAASHGYERTHKDGLHNTLNLLALYLGRI